MPELTGGSSKEIFEMLNKNKNFSKLHKQLMKTKEPYELINLVELINLEEKLTYQASKILEDDFDKFVKN